MPSVMRHGAGEALLGWRLYERTIPRTTETEQRMKNENPFARSGGSYRSVPNVVIEDHHVDGPIRPSVVDNLVRRA